MVNKFSSILILAVAFIAFNSQLAVAEEELTIAVVPAMLEEIIEHLSEQGILSENEENFDRAIRDIRKAILKKRYKMTTVDVGKLIEKFGLTFLPSNRGDLGADIIVFFNLESDRSGNRTDPRIRSR